LVVVIEPSRGGAVADFSFYSTILAVGRRILRRTGRSKGLDVGMARPRPV
jgi:hypothetical protein